MHIHFFVVSLQQKQKTITNKKQRITMEQNNIKTLAAKFLAIADELNEKVSAYIDGSNAAEDEAAYNKVLDAEREFTNAVNRYYGENWKVSLNYELAESFI